MPLTIKIDKWDSYFFRKKVAKVNVSGRVDEKSVADLIVSAKKRNISFLMAQLRGNNLVYEKSFTRAGFKICGKGVDSLLNLKRKFLKHYSENVRNAKEKDLLIVSKIAAKAFLLSYLYSCGIAGRETINRYHSVWVKNLFKDKRCSVYVIEAHKKICGFAAFKFNARAKTGRIVLIAIKNNYRGKGYGELLLKESLNLASLKANKIFVKTQRQNARAIYLYEKLGFKAEAVDETLCLKIR